MMLEEKMLAYAEKFDDGFPMIPLGWGRSNKQVIEIIDKCLKAGKDVYEMGLIEDADDPDVLF